MLKVFYHPKGLHGPLYKDGDVESAVERYWKLAKHVDSQSMMLSQEVVVLAIRVAVKEGKIPHDKVEINFVKAFDGFKITEIETLHLKPDGNFEEKVPNGFCDIPTDLLVRLTSDYEVEKNGIAANAS